MPKAGTKKTSPAKITLRPRQQLAERDMRIIQLAAKGETAAALAKKAKISTQRVYSILGDAKKRTAATKTGAKVATASVVAASPVGRAQNLLLRVAVLKEAVRTALESPKARFTASLGDEILGALASAKTAEIAVAEASTRLDNVRRKLQAKVVPGKLSKAAIGWKAIAQATRARSAVKAPRA